MTPTLEPYIAAAGRLCAELGVYALVVLALAFLSAIWRGLALRRFAAGLKPGRTYSI
jgi:hypothetical protein